jgi:hypothetical protein
MLGEGRDKYKLDAQKSKCKVGNRWNYRVIWRSRKSRCDNHVRWSFKVKGLEYFSINKGLCRKCQKSMLRHWLTQSKRQVRLHLW